MEGRGPTWAGPQGGEISGHHWPSRWPLEPAPSLFFSVFCGAPFLMTALLFMYFVKGGDLICVAK